MRRAAGHAGFTIVELLAVMAVVAILLAIIVPSYLGNREKAWDATAAMNIRATLPAVEAYQNDHDGYAGMTVPALRAYTPGVGDVTVLSAAVDTYCVRSEVGGRVWFKNGPGGDITRAACS
jgi:prepilin-type N-terminal cleavage/methylation domain-containing protein